MNEVFQSILPGMMYFWVLFLGQTLMAEVVQERDNNTLFRILSGPVTLSQFVLSKMLRCFVLCTVIQALLLVLCTCIFGIHWGPVHVATVIVLASALSMTGLLAFLYSFSRTKEQARVFTTIALLICALLGGSMFPFEMLPHFLQVIGQFTPNRWGVIALQRSCQAHSFDGMGQSVVILTSIGIGGCAAGFLLFQRNFGFGGRK
mgnify:CR=1 FL=1